MTKIDLCVHLAQHFRSLTGTGRPAINRDGVRALLQELERVCLQELKAKGQFSVTGIAKLVVESRRARRGRNPVTGEAITIPARRVVRARISSKIRRELEGPL